MIHPAHADVVSPREMELRAVRGWCSAGRPAIELEPAHPGTSPACGKRHARRSALPAPPRGLGAGRPCSRDGRGSERTLHPPPRSVRAPRPSVQCGSASSPPGTSEGLPAARWRARGRSAGDGAVVTCARPVSIAGSGSIARTAAARSADPAGRALDPPARRAGHRKRPHLRQHDRRPSSTTLRFVSLVLTTARIGLFRILGSL